MGGIRLRTKFLLSMVVVSAALTFTTLLVVRHNVQQEVRLGIQRDLENSVSAFRSFQQQREVTLERSAALLADLPIVRALHDHSRSRDYPGRFAGLVAPRGQRLAATGRCLGQSHGAASHLAGGYGWRGAEFFPRIRSERGLARRAASLVVRARPSLRSFPPGHYFGPASGHQVLGYLLLGYEIDDHVARDLSRVAASEVAFRYGDVIVRSTLKPAQETELLEYRPEQPQADRPKGIRYGWARNASWRRPWICRCRAPRR